MHTVHGNQGKVAASVSPAVAFLKVNELPYLFGPDQRALPNPGYSPAKITWRWKVAELLRRE